MTNIIKRDNCTISEAFEVSHLVIMTIPPVPREDDTLETQLEFANCQIQERIQAYAPNGHVVQQTFFLKNYADREACQRWMKTFYGNQLPVNVYVPQPPCEGQFLAIETTVDFSSDPNQVRVEHLAENLVVSHHSGASWYYTCQQEPDYSRTVYAQSVEMFQNLDRTFASVGIPFEQVIRTWLYLGNITEPTFSQIEGETQRYKELNRGRSDFFRDIHFFEGMMPKAFTHAVYPASTGIGGDGDTMVMGALAVDFDQKNGAIIPLENPQQVSAFDYGEEYSLKSPKFARALLTTAGDAGVIFVSGTASITDAESRYDGDPIAQTVLTLENIAVLISESNLEAHGKPGFGCELDDLAAARVYIKRRQDYSIIRATCERLMPTVPKIYTFADVCRPELLVEIEGVAFTGKGRNEN